MTAARVALLLAALTWSCVWPPSGDCGQKCDVVFPGSTTDLKAYDAHGDCVTAGRAIETCDHAPCADQACGAACDPCPPDTDDCAFAGISSAWECGADGRCQPFGGKSCP